MSKIPPSVRSMNDWPSGAELSRGWPAQQPSEGFAERTVNAMLAGRERRAARVAPKRLGRLVLLAALVSASAWGALRVAHDFRPAPMNADIERDAPPAVAPPIVIVAPLTSSGEPPHPSAEPKARPKARAVATAPRQEPASAAANVPPPNPVLPRCQCAPGFVVCGCSD